LEDHKAVIVEHEITERQLFENATMLMQSLTSTITDVDGLHNKIGTISKHAIRNLLTDRKKGIEEENKRKIGEFCRYLVKRINALEERTNQFETEQRKAYQQYTEKVADFVNQKNQVPYILTRTYIPRRSINFARKLTML
jgi:hypothetical protein